MRLFFFFQWNREELQEVRNNSLYMLFWHTPVNYPLWFLRDLICMSALSPLFYAFFKYLKIYGLLILLALYLSVWETNIAGLSMTAIMFLEQVPIWEFIKRMFWRFVRSSGM